MGGEKMPNFYIHVGSVTNAMRGKQLLEEQGMRAYLHRTQHPSIGMDVVTVCWLPVT